MRCAQAFQFQLKPLFLVIFGCAILLSVAAYVYRTYQREISATQDAYAASEVTDMLIYHINLHQGDAPTDWQDLEAAYQYVNSGYNSFSLDELRERVDIDFGGFALALKGAAESVAQADPPQVIVLKAGGQSEVIEAEANKRLWAAATRELRRRGTSLKEREVGDGGH